MLKQSIFSLLLFISLLFSTISNIIAQTNNDEIIKVDTALVNIPVIISDRNGRYIAGLQTQNFTLLEDGKPQKIEYFASEESPISVAILLDTSRSTQQVLGKIKKSAREFIKQLEPADRCLIMSFDNDIEILSEFTSDHKILDKAIKKAEIGERIGTMLHDAVFDAVDKEFSKIKGRKAIILLTDGKDAGSYVNKRDLIYRLEESDTLVYPIFYETENFRRLNNNRRGIFFPDPIGRGGMRGQRRQPFPDNFPGPNQNPDNRPRKINQQLQNQEAAIFLQRIADVTAGRFYQREIKDLDETFKNIADELRKQYLIGYYPENSDSSKSLHQVKVRVDLNDAVVRAKTSYRTK